MARVVPDRDHRLDVTVDAADNAGLIGDLERRTLR
jgi:hypothetical protein